MSEDVSGDKTKSNSIQDNYDYNNIDKLNGQVGLKGEVKDNTAISPDKKAAEKDFSKVRMKPILKQRKVERIESNKKTLISQDNKTFPQGDSYKKKVTFSRELFELYEVESYKKYNFVNPSLSGEGCCNQCNLI